MTAFVAPRPKTYLYLDDNCKKHKKAKGTKKMRNIDHKKDLKAITMMFIQKKLIRLH